MVMVVLYSLFVIVRALMVIFMYKGTIIIPVICIFHGDETVINIDISIILSGSTVRPI